MKKLDIDFVKKVVFVAFCLFVIFNFSVVEKAFYSTLDTLQPLFWGIVFALILSSPMDFFEYKIFPKISHHRLRKNLSLMSVLILFFGAITIIMMIIIPSIIDSIKVFLLQITNNNYFEQLKQLNPTLSFIISQFQLFFDKILSPTKILNTLLNMAVNTVKGLTNLFFGIGICIMILCNRDKLKYQSKRVIKAIFKKHNVDKISSITSIALQKFSRYLSGQMLEAVILGCVCYIGISILRIPFRELIAVIFALSNLIPIVGAYLGGTICTIIIYSVNPSLAMVFIVFSIILQQVEGMTTYPIVVGKYVGLNGFWIMLSVVLWGGLLGFWGVFLGVPFTAFIHDYVSLLTKDKKIDLAVTS